MLVLTRKVGEEIWIGDDIRIVVSRCHSGQVRLAFDAPREVKILRAEIKRRQEAEASEAAA